MGEKRLGLTVGMLNDRDKVNRPGSQHGFINFLVAPLVSGTIRLFPMLQSMLDQMAMNLGEWATIWAEEVRPSLDDLEKRELEVQKILAVADDLRQRSLGLQSTA